MKNLLLILLSLITFWVFGQGTSGTKLTAGNIGNYAWKLTGNSGTNPATNFVGTTDNIDLIFKRNNNYFGSATYKTGLYHFFIGDTLDNKIISTSWDNNGDYYAQISSSGASISIQDTTVIIAATNILIDNGSQAAGKVLTSDSQGLCSFVALSASDYSGIPAYADNATAVGVLGAGKLYYTDVAGEYILKVTH